MELTYFELQRLKLLVSTECANRHAEDSVANKNVVDQLDEIYHKLTIEIDKFRNEPDTPK